MENTSIIILAAGKGTRMNSPIPKVLHEINGTPMIVKIIKTCLSTSPKEIFIVVGEYKNIIEITINKYIKYNKNINYVLQNEQLGTGHAVRMCIPSLKSSTTNNVIVLSGDTPLISSSSLYKLSHFKNSGFIVGYSELPFGYGRVVLTNGKFIKIVEEKDCNDSQKKICLINTGVYIFKKNILINNIDKITNKNNQKEYYLTDILEIINKNSDVDYYIHENHKEFMGVNTIEQLKMVENVEKVHDNIGINNIIEI
jgi:bifunctional UDP-N-acetylglucosamine pyrophosphorylase/glucosamine-1-phosphate N-acetyltransferase